MVKVIINADDYAYDENRTKAILSAWKLGAITQTTVLVNYPGLENAVALAKQEGLFDHMGLHLNLTRGYPLTDEICKSRLFCDEKGEFNGGAYRRRRFGRFVLPKFEQQIVAKEAKAQMEKYIALGAPLMHLDSHHHVHADFSIARIVLPIARTLGFKSVRRAADVGICSVLKRCYKKLYNRYAGGQLSFATNYFCSFMDFERHWQEMPDGVCVEVMTHPMFGTLSSLDIGGELNDTDYAMSNELDFWNATGQVKRCI